VSLPPARPRILIVEDDRDLRHIYSGWLRVAGFDVNEASDGIDALEILDSGNLPDAIVLDLLLPTLDGVAVRDEIASHSNTRDIPVVVVTGRTADAIQLNVATVLQKPIGFNQLVSAVRNALH
jgi:CheY-like chemotaxis protein